VQPGGPGRVVRRSNDLAEIAYRHKPGGRQPFDAFPFEASLHYVLRRGESGFHLFATLEHRPDAPRAEAGQYAYNLRLDPRQFDVIAVDERRRHAAHTPAQEKQAERVMDATFRLADGRVVSKYNYCLDITDGAYHAYGWAASREGRGVWLVQPSAEYYACAPFRQFLTSHQTTTTPVIIWQPQCTHFGSRPVLCEPGEAWRKLYGPLFFYVNCAESVDALWADAGRKARELAAAWPYSWMQHEDYPVRRGRVTGRLRFTDGRPATDAWVILSPPETPWWQDWRGYHFWARTDARGHFAIGYVRAGSYRLAATGADQFQEFERENPVAVEEGRDTALGLVEWTPAVHGRRLWQIGVADRSSGEFRNGDDYRHWGLWRRYPSDFPEGVRFVIGRSGERRDWNFAHWNWHCRDPAWRIEFGLDRAPIQGRAYLTIGVAAAAPHDAERRAMTKRGTTDLRVAVNGREIGAVRLPYSGGAGHRSGRQTTPYSAIVLPFEATLLREGANLVTLRHAASDPYQVGDPMGERGAGPGYLMYDAIRLELE
jgi:rhamnogalacturonan endolyase